MGAGRKTRPAGVWTKFRLLMWKNILQQWRHPVQTAVELVVPVIAMALILLVRWQIEPTQRDTLMFSPFPAHTLNNSLVLLDSRGGMNISELTLAYSPESEVLEEVLTSAITDLLIRNAIDLVRIIIDNPNLIPEIPGFPNITIPSNITFPPEFPEGFPNITLPDIDSIDWSNFNRTIIYQFIRSRIRPYQSSSDLRGIYALEETTRTVLAAVEFDDSLIGATSLPDNITYALRFPERPRQHSFFGSGSRSWRTDILFPAFETPGPRSRQPDGGSDPGYVREMFIALQNAISTELVSRLTGESLQSFEVNLQRFPHPAYIHDLAVTTLQFLLPGFILLSFSYTAINIVRAVTVEKELQLKETLKIMGMPTWINWTAWFCKQFIFLMVSAALITVLVKVNWFTTEDGFGDYAVFTHTPWTVIYFYLLVYLACTIFFCFMMSGIFSKGSTAALFTGVVWFLTFIPAFLLSADVEMSQAVQFITCLGINSAMSYGFSIILAKESIGGMQWGDFMSAPATDSSRMVFGHVIIMLFVNCVLYMLVALYLEQVLPGPYGTPKPWYFLFHKNFWCSFTEGNGVAELETPHVIKDEEPIDLPVGVKITNLTKVFGNSTAVNKLTLNIYDDQITVLLGHNGAGKSTTISMLTGNLPATSGSVWVAGHNMAWHSSEARAHIGLCPQHNVLFNDLTVKEHLQFFAMLKGYRGKEMHDETDALIEKLELQSKRDSLARGLSGGQKRRLCVGIALSGAARVVLLDEPSSGMDPSSRRALWDLLQKEKKNRSMILTTHFMDEADILGDRIAIMANGRLQCVGSPYFLKRHYGVGYTLVIVKHEGFNLDACTEILKKYIPDITVHEDRGREVTYCLTNGQSHVFETMLTDLENNKESVKYKNYGLLTTTMEDVFIKVGSDVAPVNHSDLDDSEVMTEASSDGFDRTSVDCLDSEKQVRGFKLILQHCWAVWLKLFLVYARSWQLLLLQVLVPLLLIIATLGVMEFIMGLNATIQRRPLSFDEGYTSTESLVNYEGGNATSFGALATAAYEQLINASGIPTMTVSVLQEPLDEFYLRETSDALTMGRVRHRWLAGATFEDESATAWFSNFGYHDIAASLSAVHNALLRAKHPTAEIRVYNHPLEVQYEDQSDMQLMVTMLASQLASGIGSSLGIASAVFVMFYIKERALRAKLLQRAASVRPLTLWGAAAVFDWLWFLIISLTVVFSCLVFGVIGLSSSAELGRLYLMLMVYGAAMLPFHYIGSLLFKGPALGFVVLYFTNVVLGNMGSQLVEMLSMPFLDTEEAAHIIDYVLQFFPLYSLITGVRSLNDIGMSRHSCLEMCENLKGMLNIEECTMAIMCVHNPENCCVPEDPYFSWESPGVLRYLLAMLFTCVILWAVLMSIEYNLWERLRNRSRHPPPLAAGAVDADVADEARHAAAAANDTSDTHTLVAHDLTKYYRNHLAVNQVSFTVSESECFGLLGVNGAGKTTTFKMLMGDETVSSGDAFVAGHSIRKDLTKVHENIGYCPQFDAVFGELTGRETLRLFSLLRGLGARHAAARAAALAHALGFTRHLDKRISAYSGGNKRKLSTAVALLGSSRLVFVDEPTTGIDPAAKRQVWRAIRGAMRSGRGVVLTSHSMEECEALCSRLTIMVNGRFQCLGTPQHLKNKYSQGFTLTIKMKTGQQRSLATAPAAAAPVDAVKQYVTSNFGASTLMEEHQGLLTYYLADRSIPWSRMFGIMERAKLQLPIEDYTISQTTLEQIFLQFTKYQQSAPVFR